MYYNSVVAGGIQDFYFAATSKGIYDITAGGAGPHTEVLAWPNTGGKAGWCSVVNYTLVDGTHNLLVCDEDNGYYIFDGTTWEAGTFTGNPKPLAADLVHITEWQGRIWFVERNTARAWFLDPLALTGDITPFDVGSRFKRGGHLVQNTTWTLDDGAGMDDRFVMISSSGDLLVWTGVNPTTSDDMVLQGRWVVGAVPEGRRVMSDWGGDVAILSTNGLLTVSSLLTTGKPLAADAYLSYNISRYVRSEMAKTLNEFGWSIEIVPSEGVAVITVPQPLKTSRDPVQFVVNTTTNAWCMFRDLDMVCQNKNNKGYFFGTHDGRVMMTDGEVDNANLAGTSAQPIKFSMLSHYSDLGSPATWKRPQFVRPSWLANSEPTYAVQVRFDYDINEIATIPPHIPSELAVWDTAIWDADSWGGSAQSFLETVGQTGMGRTLALAIRGESTVATSYLGADVMVDQGGIL
ncbi:MAG: hypothetical protein DRH90_24490 [Deltaproteobacteria bacterium]|nr:MAG: hypothetical protein DRH90_24490 [Deltaproteobacteria bacterium]